MNFFFVILSFVAFFFCLSLKVEGQVNQTVVNGEATTGVNFPGTGCVYNWVNDTPGIGLPASGTGYIGSFIAVNKGNLPVTATITATPAPAGYAYITNHIDGTVSVINTVTNLVTATVTVAQFPIGISVSQDGKTVFVANETSSVSVIDVLTNTVTATIPVASPYGLAVSPDGSRIYVTNLGSGTATGTVSVINSTTQTVVAVIPVGLYPGGIAISPDGSRLYVTSLTNYISVNGIVSVINTNTNKVVSTIAIGYSPVPITVSPDGKWVYTTHFGFKGGAGAVLVINAATDKVASIIGVGPAPDGIAASPDGTRLYVTDINANLLFVINTIKKTVLGTIKIGTAPFGVSVSNDGLMVYVVNSHDNTVSVINTTNNTVITTIPVGNDPVSFGNFVTGGIGCSSTPVTFTITVNPTGYDKTLDNTIPNVFTPNGDGINDTWNIKYLNLHPNCTVNIFDRWGQKVYFSVGYGIPWDGTRRGEALPAGTYYYIIDLKNNSKALSGYVAIIR